MISSRALNLLRAAPLLKNNTVLKQSVRNSGHNWFYRIGSHHNQPKWQTYVAEGVAGFMWWWIFWHLWTEPGHIFGEFEYPDASKWTDVELGIPED